MSGSTPSNLLTNHSLVYRPSPYRLPGDASVSQDYRPLWTMAAIPTSILPRESHQALLDHISPPRRPRPNRSERSMTNNPYPPRLDSIDTEVDRAGFGLLDQFEASAEVGDIEQSQQLEDINLQARPNASSTLTDKRPRSPQSTLPNSDQTASSSGAPTKRSRRKLHPQAHRSLSSAQRGHGSTRARQFLSRLRHFVFEYNTRTIPQLVEALEPLLVKPPNTSTSFILSHFESLIAEEALFSKFSPAGLLAMEDQGNNFRTYMERRGDWVDLLAVGGMEEGSISASRWGICDLANQYAACEANFTPGLPRYQGVRYMYAPRLDSGSGDLAVRPWSDDETDNAGVQVETPTALLIERKLDITLRDWVVLWWVLRKGIKFNADDDGKPVWDMEEAIIKLLSAAVRAILVQLSQEFHANKAKYILLATHDVHLLFELKSRNRANVSRLLFRDPETSISQLRDAAFLADLLSALPTQYRNDIERLVNNDDERMWEPNASRSVLQLLVAGLVVNVGHTEGLWLNRSEMAGVGMNSASVGPRPSSLDITESASGVATSSGGPSATASMRDQGSPMHGQRLTLNCQPSRVRQLDNGQGQALHYIPMDLIGSAEWTIHPSFIPLPRLRLSRVSDASTSTGSANRQPQTPKDELPDDLFANAIVMDKNGGRNSPFPNSSPVTKSHSNDVNLADSLQLCSQIVSEVEIEKSTSAPLDPSLRRGLAALPASSRPSALATLPRLRLELTEYLSSGRVWDVYRALVINEGHLDQDDTAGSRVVIVKISNPEAHRFRTTRRKEFGRSDVEHVRDAITNELQLIGGPLSTLQGKVVPYLIGAWRGKLMIPCPGAESDMTMQLHILVMEDCGQGIADGSAWSLLYEPREDEGFPKELSMDDKLSILQLYEHVHAQCVLHNDISPRHITIHPLDGRPRLIDFEAAECVMNDTHFREILRDEQDLVRCSLEL